MTVWMLTRHGLDVSTRRCSLAVRHEVRVDGLTSARKSPREYNDYPHERIHVDGCVVGGDKPARRTLADSGRRGA